MKIFVVYKEYQNWQENNGTEIIGAYNELEKAENKFEKIYIEEKEHYKELESNILKDKKIKHFAEISSLFGDVFIFIQTLEIE